MPENIQAKSPTEMRKSETYRSNKGLSTDSHDKLKQLDFKFIWNETEMQRFDETF